MRQIKNPSHKKWASQESTFGWITLDQCVVAISCVKSSWGSKTLQHLVKNLGKWDLTCLFVLRLLVVLKGRIIVLIAPHRNLGHNKFKSNVSLTELTEVILTCRTMNKSDGKYSFNSVQNINPMVMFHCSKTRMNKWLYVMNKACN